MTDKRIYAKINIAAIKQNLLNVREKLEENTRLCAVVKADGYGHGAVEIAKAAAGIADSFAVATIEEAVELRECGVSCDILILGYLLPCFYKSAIENNITLTVFSLYDAENIACEARKLMKTAKVHIALDTGMGRIGFNMSEESIDSVLKICALEGIYAEGIFTHFATADEADKTFTLKQKAEFDNFLERLSEKGIKIPVRHCQNSAAIMDGGFSYEMVRCGIVTYGLYPSKEVERENLKITPAMELKSHVAFIKKVPAGTPISYGATYKTESEAEIATIPAGYADGYPRTLSNSGRVLIGGKSAAITGRVCMDQFMVDVTGLGVRAGDSVTLMGKDGDEEITADEIAEKAGTINYEIVCGIGKRVPRIY